MIGGVATGDHSQHRRVGDNAAGGHRQCSTGIARARHQEEPGGDVLGPPRVHQVVQLGVTKRAFPGRLWMQRAEHFNLAGAGEAQPRRRAHWPVTHSVGRAKRHVPGRRNQVSMCAAGKLLERPRRSSGASPRPVQPHAIAVGQRQHRQQRHKAACYRVGVFIVGSGGVPHDRDALRVWPRGQCLCPVAPLASQPHP